MNFNNSEEQLVGKAGEHFVCADLLTKGYHAFLADSHCNYDVIVEHEHKLTRINVKTTKKPYILLSDKFSEGNQKQYRFGLRSGKGALRAYNMLMCDYFAFVALDQMKIAYLPVADLASDFGRVKQLIEFKSRAFQYKGREYSNGTIREPFGKFIEDYAGIQL